MTLDFDADLDTVAQNSAKTVQLLQQLIDLLKGQGASALPSGYAYPPPPSTPPASGAAAVQQAAAQVVPYPPIQTATTVPLQNVAAGQGLLSPSLPIDQSGTVVIVAAINASATGTTLKISRNGGGTYNALNGTGGGGLNPGDEYAFFEPVARGETVQLSVAGQTTFDWLDVFYIPGRMVVS